MYEYSTLPNSWEEQNNIWEHYYAEQFLGTDGCGALSQTEFEMMCITMAKAVEQLEVTSELERVHLPEDVYNVELEQIARHPLYLRRHFEGKELPCLQQLI